MPDHGFLTTSDRYPCYRFTTRDTSKTVMNRSLSYLCGLMAGLCLASTLSAKTGENGPYLRPPAVVSESPDRQTLPTADRAEHAPLDDAGRHLSRAWWHVRQAVQRAARPSEANVDASADSRRFAYTHRQEASVTSDVTGDADHRSDESLHDLDQRNLPPEMEALRDRIRRVLAAYYGTPVNTRDHSPWEIMHWIVAYGVEAPVRRGGPGGDPITAIGWLCFNGRGGSQRLLYPSGQEQFGLHHGPGVQGHSGQFLAILAQSRVMRDYPIQIGDARFTVDDLVQHEKRTCRSGTELTFKLIGLAHYLDFDAQWQSDAGGTWNIPKLIREEIAQPIRGAACGGTHRLMGLSYVVQKRAKRGEPMIGQYRRAATYVRDYHKYTFKLQNPDGSFSTEWFRGRGNRPDPARKLQTTGHILEWLVFSLPEQELQDPRTVRCVRFLSHLLDRNRNRRWRIGPLGHALRALMLYDQRAFGGTADDYLHPSGDGDHSLAIDDEGSSTRPAQRR